MKIDILCTDGSPLGVSYSTLWGDKWQVGVGGAELALLTLCEMWTKVGHEVCLYNDPRELNASPFEQRAVSTFDPKANRDILIVFRSPNPKAIVANGLKIWFSCDQYTNGDYSKFAPTMDKIICISPHHANYFASNYGIKNTTVIDLPVRVWDYDGLEIKKVPNRLIFTSIPERGLVNLRKIWAKLVFAVPDISLVITSDYRLWGAGNGAMNEKHRVSWLQQGNVQFLGAIPRKRLIEEELKADLFPYSCSYEELFCVYGDAKIRTLSGIKTASNISVNDYVMTESGNFSKISHKYIWLHKNLRYDIKTIGNSTPLSLTDKHKLLAIKHRHCFLEPINKKFKLKSNSCCPEWISAKDLSVGDILLSSFPRDIIDKEYLYISSYVKNLTIIGNKSYQINGHANHGRTLKSTHIPDEIPVNNKFLKLLGYYIAEGSTGGGTIQFTIHENELNTIGKEIIDYMLDIFNLSVNYVKRKHTKAIQLWACSTPLARFFELLCGRGARNKHIPEWGITLPHDKQIQLLLGMILGDGHVRVPSNTNSYSIVYTTASVSLAYQVRDILARLGVCSSIKYRKAKSAYAVIFSGEQIIPLLKLLGYDWIPSRKSSHRMWIHDGYIHMPITEINSYESFDATYDFTVKGNEPSFHANGKIIHNCISCAESQYAGAYPVTSGKGALATTNMGTIVPGNANEWEFLDAFSDTIIRLLRDREQLNILQREVKQRALERFHPDIIMKEWNKIFNDAK